MKCLFKTPNFQNFSVFFQSDSIRVEGRGKATVCDVNAKKLPSLNSETDSPKIAELRSELDKYNAIRNNQEDQRDILKKKIGGLERTVGRIGKGIMNPKRESGSVVIDENLLTGLQKLLDFQETEMNKLNEQLREKEHEILKTIEMASKIGNELNRLVNSGISNMSHTVFITLEAFEDGDVELDITYQVFQAGWQPSYDIRVDTEKPTMAITYFGKIYNHCGEDWNEFPAVLSTAQPSLGGQIPELGVLDAHFYRPALKMRRQRGLRIMNRRGGPRMLSNYSNEIDDGVEEVLQTMAPPPMEVTKNTLSTEFRIARKATILNGVDDHKVTIGTIELIPSLLHQSVPSKNASALLTASAVNTSVLPLLSGETSIFLNNAFVAKSHMKDVSPGERFTCSLGVDTAIRIEYKPAKKFHEEGGYITKHSTHATEQTISVKNTRSGPPVLLTIKHHVPRSTDEKIRVKLTSPVGITSDQTDQINSENAEPNVGIILNKDNNLEWTIKLDAISSKDLLIKWIVEHAKGENIELRENLQ
ncbi:DUF4139 domain-containing protein [Caenorhabditis elegans]|uniref:DUF4139 domain-containing protein n=1 Tax=Caenorhabditis elegans TaxID=6239 RepID=H2KZL9_CAEEL|nr:DUF4139 domain-containing protein [Caenorhabditis elegans]CCD68849.1 DUF4139 domain-containing protein [Caenorhabditis elegans]|eukprot:NP_504679.1 Uncharacterized protein CELE_ZK1055.6 [Caenorhabditis elegans]